MVKGQRGRQTVNDRKSRWRKNRWRRPWERNRERRR